MNPIPTFIVCLGTLLLSACHPPHSKHEETPTLQVTSPLRRDTILTEEYVGQIRAIQHIEIRALERGYLEGIEIDEGQLVQEGAKMFQIMPMLYRAEVQKAQAETELAQIEFNNTKLLADKNIVSSNELALSQAKVNKAKAQLGLAATHQGLTTIRAPFSGIMGRFHVRQGSLLDEGDLLTTLSDNSKVWVYFNVTEREYLDYKSKNHGEKPQVQLRLANDELFDQPGVVETIEADFNNETGNIAFRATFENPKGLLRHGETGKVVMNVPVNNALLIPQKATFEILDKRFVYVVDEKNVVHSRAVQVAAELPQIFIINEGLKENEKLLLEGLRKVHEGSQIHVKFESPKEVFAHLELRAE